MKLIASALAGIAMAGLAWAQEPASTTPSPTPAPAPSGDAAVLASFEKSWETAADAAASVVVSIRIEREPAPERPKPRDRRNPGESGGVFDQRPEKILYACPTCGTEGAPSAECATCKVEYARTAVSRCTGTIIDKDGLIATTHFNLNPKPTRITVTVPGRGDFKAKLLGYNAGADIGLLRIEEKDLPVLKTTELGKLKTGRPVVALGRTPDGASLTVNPGIMSAPSRVSGYAIQTDAHTNYGNVGGPLVDTDGALVGITCKVDTKYAGTYGQNSGISFAVTYDQLVKILPELRAGRSTQGTGRPFMGVTLNHDDQDLDGVKVSDVHAGGGAEKAGVRVGDIILSFDGVKVKTFSDLTELIGKKAVNDPFQVRILRDGEEMLLSGTLGERMAD
jgi:S1-C subfamily serine protease